MEKQEKQAIEILHMMCGNNGCVISDSGGKDSSVLKHIALKVKNRYGLEYKIRHNHTTVDAPETVYFIRREKEKYEAMGVPYEIFYPAQSMWQLIVSHGTPPTRIMRYCCKDLKENTGLGEKLVTGVRKAESRNRKENIELNPLYGCGWGRVGCIGCPLAGKHRWREFERYPKYRDAYIRAFEKMIDERKRRGLKTMEMWSTGKKVFKWWMEDENLDGQLAFDLDGNIYEEYT